MVDKYLLKALAMTIEFVKLALLLMMTLGDVGFGLFSEKSFYSLYLKHFLDFRYFLENICGESLFTSLFHLSSVALIFLDFLYPFYTSVLKQVFFQFNKFSEALVFSEY